MVQRLHGFNPDKPDAEVQCESLAACGDNVQRYNASITFADNISAVFVTGGRPTSYSDETLKTCFKYSITRDEWTRLPDMSQPCEAPHTSCVMDHWLYVFHAEGCERLHVRDYLVDFSGSSPVSSASLWGQ